MSQRRFDRKGCAWIVLLDLLAWIAIVAIVVYLLESCHG
jgi:hypothetical protein